MAGWVVQCREWFDDVKAVVFWVVKYTSIPNPHKRHYTGNQLVHNIKQRTKKQSLTSETSPQTRSATSLAPPRISTMALACQVVNGDGMFEEQDVQQFFGASKMDDVGRDYQVVAIMGPQSSGKSTLLNHVVCRWLVV